MTDTTSTAPPLLVERWPTEIPLLLLCAVVSAALWVVAVVTILPIVYAAMLGVFFFVAQLMFVWHVRGNGVRVGPDQLPHVHEAVARIAANFGMKKVPEVYVLQAGGALNALATRLFRSNLLVLFSDLLEACGDDAAARDMIIGHELGHVLAGHLRWHWFLIPAWLVPFLGTGLSRAREYTCDRYGAAAAGSREGALLGLSILAAGASYGRRIDLRAFARQREGLNKGWMVLAEWLATHPPLAKRVVALAPAVAVDPVDVNVGYARAIGILVLAALPFVAAALVGLALLPKWVESVNSAAAKANTPQPQAARKRQGPPPAEGLQQTISGLKQVAAVIDRWRAAGQDIPWDAEDLHERWLAAKTEGPEPTDPFDDEAFGYEQRGGSYRLWGVGPDGEPWTWDDVIYDSRTGTVAARKPSAAAK